MLEHIAKPIQWLGDSRDRLRRFPRRRDAKSAITLLRD